MIRTVMLFIMVSSFFGLGICDCLTQHWRTGIASILLGIVQIIIFWGVGK